MTVNRNGIVYKTGYALTKHLSDNARHYGSASLAYLGGRYAKRTSTAIVPYVKPKKNGNLRGAKKASIHQGANAGVSSNSGTWSRFNYGNRKVKHFGSLKSLQPQNYILNSSVRATSGVGQQTFSTLTSMFTQGDLNQMLSQPSFASNNATKLLYKSCAGEILITNQEPTSCRIILYDMITRRDTSATNDQDPAYAVAHSFGDEYSGSNANSLIPGVSPFQSKTFVDYYKVLKITNIELTSGQTHTHKFKFMLNKGIDGEVIEQTTATALKGITCYTMMQQFGMPNNDSGTKSQVSLGSTALDVVIKRNYVYYYTTQSMAAHRATQTIVTSYTTGEEAMNEKTGANITLVGPS